MYSFSYSHGGEDWPPDTSPYTREDEAGVGASCPLEQSKCHWSWPDSLQMLSSPLDLQLRPFLLLVNPLSLRRHGSECTKIAGSLPGVPIIWEFLVLSSHLLPYCLLCSLPPLTRLCWRPLYTTPGLVLPWCQQCPSVLLLASHAYFIVQLKSYSEMENLLPEFLPNQSEPTHFLPRVPATLTWTASGLGYGSDSS